MTPFFLVGDVCHLDEFNFKQSILGVLDIRHYFHSQKLTCPLKRSHFKRKGSSSNHYFLGHASFFGSNKNSSHPSFVQDFSSISPGRLGGSWIQLGVPPTLPGVHWTPGQPTVFDEELRSGRCETVKLVFLGWFSVDGISTL